MIRFSQAAANSILASDPPAGVSTIKKSRLSPTEFNDLIISNLFEASKLSNSITPDPPGISFTPLAVP